MIGIGRQIIFLIQCRFHHIGRIHIYHTACLVFIRHGILIPICRLFLHICAQIILPIGSRQLVSHHLQIMAVLIKKSACTEKETHGDQASLSCQKRWAIE